MAVAKNNPALFLGFIVIGFIALSFFLSSSDEPVAVQKVQTNTEKVIVKNSDDAASDTAAEDRKRLSQQIDQIMVSLNGLNSELQAQNRENDMLKAKIADLTTNGNLDVNYSTDDSITNRDLTDPNVGSSFENEILGFEGDKKQADSVLDTGYRIDESENDVDSLEWIGKEDGFINSITNSFQENIPLPEQAGSKEEREKSGIIQYATIDPEAVLFDAFVFDSIIGVSPNQTGIVEPYRFKLELSNENLLTNGFQLPEIESMRMSGYAVGEWSTSCVKGFITSATFIFKDGRIHTVGNADNSSEKLAYITDQYGSPCIMGDKYSSLLEYASIHGGLSALSSIGEGLSNAQFTTTGADSGLQQAFTGDQGKLALGEGLTGGFDAISQTVAARYANVRDVIVAKPDFVIVQLSQAIEIDYDANGRKVLNPDFENELDEYYETFENNTN